MFERRAHKTRRLILRPYTKEDYQRWFDFYVHRLPQRNRYDRGPMDPKECSRQDFHRILRRHQRLAAKDNCYIYGVFAKKGGALVGTVDIFVISRDHYQMGNLGYVIHNKFWGQGLGREAALATLRIGFRNLKLNRLEAAINLDNPRSIRVVKAIGMRREGIKRRYIYEFGAWTDQITYVANPEDIGLKATKPIF